MAGTDREMRKMELELEIMRDKAGDNGDRTRDDGDEAGDNEGKTGDNER